MAKSLGRLPSASTSRLQPIGPAPVSSRRPVRPETIDLGLDEAASVPTMSWSGMRTAPAGEVVPVGLVGEVGRLELVKAVKLP
jgi:hypothetical protein